MASMKKVLSLSTLTVSCMSALVACAGSSNDDEISTIKLFEFSGISTPQTDSEMRAVRASQKVTINDKDYAIGFNNILRGGDKAGSGTFGQLYDMNGNVIVGADNVPIISTYADHSSLIQKDGKLFMVSQFEDSVGANYVTELNQDKATGKLTAISTKPIDTRNVGGTWTHCAGSNTPWGTHLGSEEYEPNAADPKLTSNTAFKALAPYFQGDLTQANPYNYGYITEVSVTGPNLGTGTFASNATLIKHYAMGRLAFEMGYVLPNQKTVYLSDDGTMVGFFRFEADNAGDLSSGTLYAARLTQKSADNGGSFDLAWISLGSAKDSDIKPYIDRKTKFSDIFNVGDPLSCSAPFVLVTTSTGAECLQVKPGMEKVASRLETRRYGAMQGATTELNKEEGITYDPASNRLFVSMSFVENGMTDGDKNENAKAINYNHVRVAKNHCGGVYALDLDSHYVAQNMYGLIAGRTVSGDATNVCALDGIANPDNLTFITGTKTLVIGEDTGDGHRNDLMWAFNTETKQLTRIFSTPYGSETTSPYWYGDINGFGYLLAVVQHPYGESDSDLSKTDPAGTLAKNSYTGYIGPFPAIK